MFELKAKVPPLAGFCSAILHWVCMPLNIVGILIFVNFVFVFPRTARLFISDSILLSTCDAPRMKEFRILLSCLNAAIVLSGAN